MFHRFALKCFPLLTLLWLAWSLGGCDANRSSPSGIVVGIHDWPGYEPLLYADRFRIFPSSVSVKRFDSASSVLNAYRSGLIHAAAVTLDEAIVLKDQGYDPLIIAVLDVSHGADVIIARPGITSVSEIFGKTIAVEASAVGSYLISRALQRHSLSADRVTLLPINASNALYAYESGIADAVVAYEPMRTRLLANGGKEIFSSRDIPNEIIDVLVIDREYATDASVRTLLAGWNKSASMLRDQNPAILEWSSKRERISLPDFTRSLDGLRIPGHQENDRLLQDGTIVDTIAKIQSVLLRYQLIQKPVDAASMLYRRP